MLRMAIEYFNSRGSTVYAAALDISKAFDTVCHSKLFRSLINAGIPTWIVLLIISWYGKLMVSVRWLDKISREFRCKTGWHFVFCFVYCFINLITVILKDCGFGCVRTVLHWMYYVCR